MISLQYQGKIYNIETEPFETIEESYKRGWFIVKQLTSDNCYNCNNANDVVSVYSSSIIMINKNKGMIY